MNNGYCIYFGDKPYFITSYMNERLYALTSWGGTILVNQPTPGAILQTIHDLDRTEAEAAIILTNKVDYYWNIFNEHFTRVEAAGGLVRNEHGEYLFIHRRGMWDLPKGKLDAGEDFPTCAVREVCEETGLKGVILGEPIGHTWHVYHEKGCFCLKDTAWYHMEVSGHQHLVPQVEEDINAVEWLPRSGWSKILAGTYASIKEVLKMALPREA